MDSHSKNWRLERLALQDSVPSASLAIAPTGTPTSAAYQSSSSGLPGGCSTDGIHQMFPGCVFVNDDDGSLQYSEGWNFSTSDPNGLIHTLHFTQTPGSSVSLTFNASRVVVFGLVPSGSSPPQASYSIDGLPAASPHMAATSQCVPNQQMFNSGDDLGAGLHNLTFEVTAASQDQPYILDYLWLCRGSSDAFESSTTSGTETHGKTLKDGVIVGVVLGAIAQILIISICAWMLMRRRRRRLEALGDALPSFDTRNTVTPFPTGTRRSSDSQVKRHDDVPSAPLSSFEEGIATLSGGPPSAGGSESGGPPSSMAPALSTTSTVLARRLEKVAQFRSLIPFVGSQPRRIPSSSMVDGWNGAQDEQPPPYTYS